MVAADRIVAAAFAKDLNLMHNERTVSSRQQVSRPNGSAARSQGLKSHGHAGKSARSPAVELEHGNSLLLSRMLADQARTPVDHLDEVVTLCEQAGRRSAWHTRA
jgi:hypothetical protein